MIIYSKSNQNPHATKFLWIYDFCFKCLLSETFWVLIFLWQTLCSLVSSAQGLVNCSVLFLVLWLLHFLMDSLCPIPNKMLICPWGRIWVRILRKRTTKVSLFMEKRSPNHMFKSTWKTNRVLSSSLSILACKRPDNNSPCAKLKKKLLHVDDDVHRQR